jgi:hypothetical protein
LEGSYKQQQEYIQQPSCKRQQQQQWYVSEGALFFHMESAEFIQTNGTRASSIGKKHNVEGWLTIRRLLLTARMVIIGCGQTVLAGAVL